MAEEHRAAGVPARAQGPTAAARKVFEELGLDRPVGRVLVVDWVPSPPERPEGLILVYDGGVLAEEEVAGIRLQPDELASYAFVEQQRVPGLTPARCRR